MCCLWHNKRVKKIIVLHIRADKELSKFPRVVQLKFKGWFELLESSGKLEKPFAKKLSGQVNLFELRVKYKGQWRATYAYIIGNKIIILAAFVKKTQKTPQKELNKSHKRLADYIERYYEK